MPDLDRAAPYLVIAVVLVGVILFCVAVSRGSEWERLAMRAYCEAKFSAATTAADTVAVLTDSGRYHCEFALIPEDR